MAPVRRNCLECAVSRTDCFCRLTSEALLGLQAAGRRIRLEAGQRLLYEGDQADSVYVICQGTVKLTTSSPDGRLMIVRIAGPGDVVGLAAVLKGTGHRVAAETLERCEVKSIERTEFLQFMERFRDVNRNATVAMATEYENAVLSARRLALSGSAAGKLAAVLLDWGRMGDRSEGEAIEFRMPLSHEELGSMAGLSRETVTRLLSKFRREGLLELEGERMILRQPEKLEALYC